MSKKVIGIIPSRLESQRLSQKALLDIHGLPMIAHVFKRSKMAKCLDAVYVATDNELIKDAVESLGGNVIMTSSKHKTGSDRIAEASQSLEADIIVNIQGDEPLLNPEHIDQVVQPLLDDSQTKIAFLITPYSVFNSSSDIKAVVDKNFNILYCSRSDIPSQSRNDSAHLWKMCFMVPFQFDFLQEYAQMEQTPLELIESNEYLRILEYGYKMKAVPIDKAHISVDTPEDLVTVRKLFKSDMIKESYMANF